MKEITSQLVDKLKEMREERIRVRRKLCSQIRENKLLFRDDGWITHKIEGRYLGDLSDIQLMNYGELLIKKKEEQKLETR